MASRQDPPGGPLLSQERERAESIIPYHVDRGSRRTREDPEGAVFALQQSENEDGWEPLRSRMAWRFTAGGYIAYFRLIGKPLQQIVDATILTFGAMALTDVALYLVDWNADRIGGLRGEVQVLGRESERPYLASDGQWSQRRWLYLFVLVESFAMMFLVLYHTEGTSMWRVPLYILAGCLTIVYGGLTALVNLKVAPNEQQPKLRYYSIIKFGLVAAASWSVLIVFGIFGKQIPPSAEIAFWLYAVAVSLWMNLGLARDSLIPDTRRDHFLHLVQLAFVVCMYMASYPIERYVEKSGGSTRHVWYICLAMTGVVYAFFVSAHALHVNFHMQLDGVGSCPTFRAIRLRVIGRRNQESY